MIRFYYTGASEYLGEQKKTYYSLGGFVSSSPIPNGSLNNIFSDISFYTIEKSNIEVIGLVLKNEFSESITNLALTFKKDNPEFLLSDYEIAFTEVFTNDNGCYYIEVIEKQQAIPFLATFVPVVFNEKIQMVESLEAGKYYGIWLKRKISDTARSFILSEEFLQSERKVKQDFTVLLNWD